jgi:hypothetical protein
MSASEDLADLARETQVMRPSFGSYLVFCGIWVSLAVAYGLLALSRPGVGFGGGAAIASGAATLSVAWMFGHRIRVSPENLEYRDGFYRTRSVLLRDIESIRHEWQRFELLGRQIGVPRLQVVARGEAKSLQINPKPFSRKDVNALSRLGASAAERAVP